MSSLSECHSAPAYIMLCVLSTLWCFRRMMLWINVAKSMKTHLAIHADKLMTFS